MTPVHVPAEAADRLDWLSLADALAKGHDLPRAQISDTFVRRGADTLLNRAAWIDGMGGLVKAATIFPGNAARGLESVNGQVTLFADDTGQVEATLDMHMVTRWKTAADSLLAALLLAPPNPREIAIIGAGDVAETLLSAYRAGFPNARFRIWNRTPERAAALAARSGAEAAYDLPAAVHHADIVSVATLSTTPVIRGNWLRHGQHVDLIGAFRADMREADDQAMRECRIFVDSFDTTLEHIGELKIPLETGVIQRGDVLADFYDLKRFARAPSDTTLFKNGGGAHLDLMTARHILDVWKAPAG